MNTYLDLFPSRRVAVVGDMMLDCYLEGSVERISPEAPVPVLLVTKERMVAGGSANVATNLATLDLHVSLVGVVGADEAHGQLFGLLRSCGSIDLSGVMLVDDRQTIKKLRVISAQQQIVRIDQEDAEPLSSFLEDRLIAAAEKAIDEADVIVVSDYGKGVCSDRVLAAVFHRAVAVGKPVIVDPKRADLAAYRGATIITPNRKELSTATQLPSDSDEEAGVAAGHAQRITGADILLTRSEKGMSYFSAGQAPFHLPTVAQAVFDVSGAGDTVVAVLAASLAAGVPIHEALRMANHAAGIVVSKLGTATVSREELAESLAAELAAPSVNDGRLLSRESLVTQRAAWARERLTVGLANGCFDLLHPGHVSLIQQAAEHCDRLVMALNSDASVRRLKGPTRPVQKEAARAAVMGMVKGVAAVTIFEEDTPLELIQALQPDVIVKGADYKEDNVVGAEIVRQRGGRVILAELTPDQSTSRLVANAMVRDEAAGTASGTGLPG
jgi:D-beta-D-heptose 7-phosphate kinase/D-beta-D-heptose 1-phosphate adenosyltransferase